MRVGRGGTLTFGALLIAALLARGSWAEEGEPEGESAVEEDWTWVLPGPEGVLSTYRVSKTTMVPLSDETESDLGTFCEDTEQGCKRPPRIKAFNSELMDLGTLRRGFKVAYLSLRASTKRKARIYLLVGARGGLSIRLDGREVGAHEDSKYRSDRTVVPLDLAPGEHRLVFRFSRAKRGQWLAKLRFLDEQFRPGAGEVKLAVGRLDEERERELAGAAVSVEELHELGEGGPEVVLRATLPGGGVARKVSLQIDESLELIPTASLHSGSIEHRLPFPAKGNRLAIKASVEGKSVKIGRWLALDRPVLQAQAALEEILESAPEASKAPLAWRASELARIVRVQSRDRAWRSKLSREAQKLVKVIGNGENPFERIKGYHRMAFFSRLDDTPQPYELFVPRNYRYDGTRQWPLLITLHGFKGNAGDYFRNTFGLPRNYAAGESLVAHGRHGKAPRRGPMFVIAPTGRGQAMYRHAGEIDILEALADVQQRFRIDPRRIYITGGSMGGTGAVYLPYRNPDIFAASAALAGYHDQRIRSDTNHEGLSDVERFLQAERSDVDWAENGLHMHTLLVRGTKDMPLEWTRSLAKRLRKLRYPYEHREPELGHNVWTETYAEGAIFRYLGPRRRPEEPRHVRFRTARERSRRSYWVEVDQRAAPDVFADIDARVGDDGQITVITEGVQALTLAPSEGLCPAGPLRVAIDGVEISGDRPLALHRGEDGVWASTELEYPLPGQKRPGVSGPIRDVYHEPLIFVVGTLDPDHLLVNRLVAQYWARPRGWIVDYPIVDDVEVTEEMIQNHNLVLIGPPRSNALTRRWSSSLPIRYESEALTIGDRRYEGEQTGAVFVAPSPDAPSSQALLVIAGITPLGTWRSLCLPDVRPDYVIFDESIAPARDRWAAGGTGASYLEEGLFEMDWSVPEGR